MRERFRSFTVFCKEYSNMIFFVGGFLFDSLTLTRIDSILDLSFQAGYLLAITWFIIAEVKQEAGWHPSGLLGKVWHLENEALHFCYGGLLSAYVVFYFKSTSFSRSFFFFLLIVGIMFANEMPQVRRAGQFLRLGLYTFCLVSFINYLLPVIIGRMGWWVFLLALVLSAWLSYLLIKKLLRLKGELDPQQKRAATIRLAWSPILVLALITGLYFLKWIPPVPLSLKYSGVFHNVEKENSHYKLTYYKPPWTRFWQKDDRVFLARAGDNIYCFVSVFGPSRFQHRIFFHWQKKEETSGKWISYGRVPLDIHGGRGEGYRGYVYKTNYEPGRWRVEVETEDGRVLGGAAFKLQIDEAAELPDVRTRTM